MRETVIGVKIRNVKRICLVDYCKTLALILSAMGKLLGVLSQRRDRIMTSILKEPLVTLCVCAACRKGQGGSRECT